MDNNLQNLKEDLSSLDKLTQSYLLLKKKICGTNELIKQYNDKQKECERLKVDLDTVTKDTKKVTYNYNSTLAKVIKLELQNTEYKKNIESLTQETNEYKIKTAADQQLIQQLKCKVKDLERNEDNKIMQYDLEKSALQVKVKDLEQELKTVKKLYDTKIKKIEKKIPIENENRPKLKEIGVNTVLTNDEIRRKPEVAEKCVLTEEAYTVKDDVYPVFCGKCEVLLEPPPLEKIFKIMTKSCPKLIENISSPKKVSPPLRASPEVSDNYCKPENLTSVPSTSPHLQNQNNHPNFIPPNVIPPHTPVSSNRSDYCTSYIPVPNLMNPGTYYIGPPPVNPVPLANLNPINQNNHSEITTLASSLSIISSLQKKIDTLETKIEKLTKTKSKRSNSCCQQQHPNTCMHDMNSSVQFNFMELLNKVTDLYDNKNKGNERFDTCDRNDKKSKHHKMARLKPKKRLQNTHAGSWRIESVSKKVEQNSSRKRPKKRNSRFSSLFSKAEVSSDNSENSENSNSDSDAFGDATNSKMDTSIKSRSTPLTEKSVMNSNASKAITCSTQSTDIDEADAVETIRNSIESNKSVGGETDSGILSDSVESSRLTLFEADVDTRLNSTGNENTNIRSPSVYLENRVRAVKNIKRVVKPKAPKRSLIQAALQRINKRTETDTGSKTPSKPNECSENVEHAKATEVSEHDDVIARDEALTSTATSSGRKRKINELQEQKACNSRGNLLKKLRNLRKSSERINNTCQNVPNRRDVPNCKNEDRSSEEQKNVERDTSIAKTEDYVPKKKPRIAHVPKNATTDRTSSSSNSSQVEECPTKSVEKRKVESQTIHADNEVPNATVNQAKMPKNDSNRSGETDEESQEADNDGTKQLESTSVNGINPDTENCMESNVDEMTTSGVENTPSEPKTKNLSNIDVDSYNRSDIPVESNVNDSVKEITNTDVKLNDRCEPLEQPCNHDDCDTIVKSDINDSVTEMKTKVESYNLCESFESSELKPEDSVEEGECSTEETSISPRKDLDARESFKEESYSKLDLYSTQNQSNDSFDILDISISKSDADMCIGDSTDVKDEHSIDDQENSIKNKSTQQAKKTTGTKKSKFNKIFNFACTYPLKKLQRYIDETKSPRTYHSRNKKLLPVRSLADKFIRKQLQRLIDSDWKTSVHWDVIEKLKSVCSSRIIAKEIVEFLSTVPDDQCLDKTYTPPAPLMTNTQQKIVALLVDLGDTDPMIFQFVQAGIEYKLFRLNNNNPISKFTIESYARMYTILARIKKDREKVRIFCCDALYCLGLNAIIVLYTVFTCWPEVFPNNEMCNKLLPRCMAHLITIQQATDYPKLKALKNLVSIFYKYPIGTVSKDLLNELLTALQEKSHTEIETAVLLLAKREGTTWAYKHVIQSALLPMIINGKLPSTYRAFWLLGNLMRVFPLEDKDNSVGKIVEQLCDLIKSGEGSSEQNEGVISALLSLSRHKFHEVVQNTLQWKPTTPVRDRTEEQFNGLFNQRNTDFWKCYLKTNKYLFVTHQERKT